MSSGPKFVDKTGLRYGKLVVVELASPIFRLTNKAKINRWKCKCDCGTIVYIVSTNLNCSKSRVRSCGCLIHESWRGTPRMHADEASLTNLFNIYQHRAKKKKYSMNITYEQFKDLTAKNCTYCGSPPKSRHILKGRDVKIMYNGIDRIDSSIGYEINNCVTCCPRCNKMKSDMPLLVFINHIKQIVEYQSIK